MRYLFAQWTISLHTLTSKTNLKTKQSIFYSRWTKQQLRHNLHKGTSIQYAAMLRLLGNYGNLIVIYGNVLSYCVVG